MHKSREEIASLIYKRLLTNKDSLIEKFSFSKHQIGFFYLDDLLPEDLALTIYNSFPDTKNTHRKKDLREYKYVAYKMDEYNPFLKEVIYAFQDKKVVKLISEICNIENVLPDESLYAGGLSLMKKGNFLNPHLDNSHDKEMKLWRVLNLLYYITPNWELKNGGNLELWNNGLTHQPIEIESKFNRLVVMATHNASWHSVNKILVEEVRCCVSNYYFSKEPLQKDDTFHITTFRGRSSEKVKDFFLKIDNTLRSGVRKIFKKGIRENPHQYKK